MSDLFAVLRGLLASGSTPMPDGCRLWDGRLDKDGYGLLCWQGVEKRTHRYSWIAHKGPIPIGLQVLHTCDVRACIDLDHLFLGTHADNMADRSRKGRGKGGVGGANRNAKLTPEAVRDIRNASESLRALAARYGVDHTTIGKIRRGERWTHLIANKEDASHAV